MAQAVYRNDSDAEMDVIGIGVILPHDQVSLTGQFMPPIILANYPGLVDVLAEEAAQVQGEPQVTQTEDVQNG